MFGGVTARISMVKRFREAPDFDWPTALALLLPRAAWHGLLRLGWWAKRRGDCVEVRLPNGQYIVAPASARNPAGLAVGMYRLVCSADQYGAAELLKPGSIVVDAGANFGAFTLFAGRLAEGGRVVAVEPVAETTEALRRTCDLNGLGNVTVVQAALSSAPGEMAIHASPRYPAWATGAPELMAAKPGGKVMVRVTSIDALAQELVLPRVDLIKIDVEGMEREVLMGARETIQAHQPVILASAYHHPDDRTELPKLIRDIDPAYVVTLVQAGAWAEEIIRAVHPLGRQ